MKFQYLVYLTTVASATAEFTKGSIASLSYSLAKRDAIHDITETMVTLNQTVTNKTSIILEQEINEIQHAESALELAKHQGDVNRLMDSMTTAVQRAFLRFALGENPIDIGAQIAKNSTLTQDEATEIITAVATVAGILRRIRDTLALLTLRLTSAVIAAFHDEISFLKSAIVLFLLPVGGLVTAIQVAGAQGANVAGGVQAISAVGSEAQNLLGSRF